MISAALWHCVHFI